jgi:hypothetical protein
MHGLGSREKLLPVAQPADTPAEAPAKGRLAWHTWVPWVLVVVATVIVLVAALNVWIKRQALSTDNWTNASGRLLENAQIRQALSVYLVEQLYSSGDVTKRLQQRLPPALDPVAPQIALGLEQASVRFVDELLARPRVQQLWKEANRRAHKRFIAVLDGKHNLLTNTNGNVVLDLRPIMKRLGERTGLGSRIVDRLPPDAGQIVLMKGNQLSTARTAVKVLRVLSYFLLFLALGLYALAIYLSRSRRGVLMGAGIGVVVVGLIILVVRRYAGNYLVDTLTSNPTDKGAIHASWAIGTELLRNIGINTLIYGIAIVFAAWVAGPGRAATWVRRELAPTMRDRPIVIYGAVTLVLIIVLLAGPTDAQRIFPLLILFAFAYVGTEVLRRQTMQEFPADAPDAVPAETT